MEKPMKLLENEIGLCRRLMKGSVFTFIHLEFFFMALTHLKGRITILDQYIDFNELLK
jgi:hypothetical protein